MYDLNISERFFLRSGSTSIVLIFFGDAAGIFGFAGEITFSIGFLSDTFGPAFGTNSSSSSLFSSRAR